MRPAPAVSQAQEDTMKRIFKLMLNLLWKERELLFLVMSSMILQDIAQVILEMANMTEIKQQVLVF